MRLKEKLRNYLTLKTHKSGAFSSAMRGHAFAIRSLFFRQNIFLLMAGLCFALFCFHLQNLLLFFFFSVSLSLAPFHSVFFETRLCCCTREKRVFSSQNSPLRSKFSRLILTDTVIHTRRAYRYYTSGEKSAKILLFSFRSFQNNFIKQNK